LGGGDEGDGDGDGDGDGEGDGDGDGDGVGANLVLRAVGLMLSTVSACARRCARVRLSLPE